MENHTFVNNTPVEQTAPTTNVPNNLFAQRMAALSGGSHTPNLDGSQTPNSDDAQSRFLNTVSQKHSRFFS